jgi:hypothetical protein
MDCAIAIHSVFLSFRRIIGGVRDRYHVPIQWLGLRPSHVAELKGELPREVYQHLTELDRRKIEKLCQILDTN